MKVEVNTMPPVATPKEVVLRLTEKEAALVMAAVGAVMLTTATRDARIFAVMPTTETQDARIIARELYDRLWDAGVPRLWSSTTTCTLGVAR